MTKLKQSSVENWLVLLHSVRSIQGAVGDWHWLAVNLSMAQLKVVLLLVHSGGLPSRAIGQRLAVGASAVTPLVDRLVKLKLARREPDAADRRVIHVRPTAKAIALHETLLDTGRTILAQVLTEVPASERESVDRALSVLRESAARVLARLQADAVAP